MTAEERLPQGSGWELMEGDEEVWQWMEFLLW